MSCFAIVVGMEENVEPATCPPPSTPVGRAFKVGDVVQVFQGTGAYVVGRKTIAYIGRIVGYNECEGKWEVQAVL
jgi:hypothetical protein